MTSATLAQADLFGDLEQVHAGPAKRAYGKLGTTGAGRVRRGARRPVLGRHYESTLAPVETVIVEAVFREHEPEPLDVNVMSFAAFGSGDLPNLLEDAGMRIERDVGFSTCCRILNPSAVSPGRARPITRPGAPTAARLRSSGRAAKRGP